MTERNCIQKAGDAQLALRRVADAAEALVRKLKECEPILTSMTIQTYGLRYEGPTFGPEREALESALKAAQARESE